MPDTASRWRYWLPIASLVSHSVYYSGPRADLVEEFRRRHASAVDSCLAAGLSWVVIVKHALDDFRVSPEQRQSDIRAAAERRRTRVSHHKKEPSHV